MTLGSMRNDMSFCEKILTSLMQKSLVFPSSLDRQPFDFRLEQVALTGSICLFLYYLKNWIPDSHDEGPVSGGLRKEGVPPIPLLYAHSRDFFTV